MKKYKIERTGDFFSPQYFITVYSGKKPLRFMVDSGCSMSTIIEAALPSNGTIKTNRSTIGVGFGGQTLEMEEVILPISLEKDGYIFELVAQVTPKSNSWHHKLEGSVGLLGAQFLQFCKVDFRNCWIEVTEQGGGRDFLRMNSIYYKNKDVVEQSQEIRDSNQHLKSQWWKRLLDRFKH